jgi:hypothetical protein
MSLPPPLPNDDKVNGHATISRTSPTAADEPGDAEPKGYPDSGRYRAETAHRKETHDPGAAKKKNGEG